MGEPADLSVAEAASLLARRAVSSVELVSSSLERIRERDGAHSFDGDAASINAWVRVYEERALEAAARADALRASGDPPTLAGVPVGLKDLFSVAGEPLTASSRLLREVPTADSDVWARLASSGMVLIGHLHTHEFAIGGTTDQVGNPWALDRSAGGSSGGSAAAVAARMVAAATGTDTAGSLRIPSALCGTSAVKPTAGLVSLRGVVPLAPTLDHAGPIARDLADCALLLGVMAGPDRGRAASSLVKPPVDGATMAGARIAVSPRIASVELDGDVAEGVDAAIDACRGLGATVIAPPPPEPLDVGRDHLELMLSELLPYHRRFDDRRQLYRPALREWVEAAERRALSAEAYVALQWRRRAVTAAWAEWLERERVAAVLEPTVPVVAPPRGDGYAHAFTDAALVSLTHHWNWTGFPVAALPAGVGRSSGLPVSVSLVGPAGSDARVLALGIELQRELGVPAPLSVTAAAP